MTRVLFIYPNAISQGFIHGGIAILSAVLKEAGHETDLFDTTFYNIESNKIETSLQFKPTDLKKKIERREVKFLVSDFLNKISTFKPDLIAITCTSNSYLLLKNLMEKTISNINCPVIIGGPKATISPEELIREDFISMVCIGEGEEALVEVANNIRDNKSLINIKNIWIKKNHRIHRNEVRLLNQNLDSLPLPDWSIFNEQHFYRPMYGNILKFGWFEMSRGCPFSCSYCINSYLHKLYQDKGKIFRTKSIERIINEIEYFKNKYDINYIRFVDETFLSLSTKELKRFATAWKSKIKIPFIMMTRPESVTREKGKILADLGYCTHVSIGIESGNEKLRKEVYNRYVKNETIIKAFQILKEAGIGTTSYNMLGAPTESRKEIFDTIKLNRLAKVDVASLSYIYPFEGTPLRERCLNDGYINEKSAMITDYTKDTILDMPQISRKELRGLYKTFNFYVKFPKIIYPLIKICEGDNKVSNSIYKILAKIYQIEWAE